MIIVDLSMSNTAATAQTFSIYSLSERALTIEFGNQISLHLLDAVSAFNRQLHDQPFPGFETTIPAYATLTVVYDPLLVAASGLLGETCFEKISNYLTALNHQPKSKIETKANLITIPVCYGGDYGPDLQELADLRQMDIDEVISIHSQAIYKVYMIGFMPGFAYLGGMDERLATPRKSTPRKSVPAGSVGIAGGQTGIYPLQSPGGWQLIGKTPLKLFNVNRAQPSLLKAGDEVQFRKVSVSEFEVIERSVLCT